MGKCLTIVTVIWLGVSYPLVATAQSAGGERDVGDSETTSGKVKDGAKPLRMSTGIVCKSIDGYEQYEILRGAALTSDEKLLVYFRPLGYQSERVERGYQAHLVPDFEIRKRGEKAVIYHKKKMFTYKPVAEQPPRYLYMKNTISLKGLAPGDYDLTLILHDEVAKGPPATQVVRFRVIPPVDPTKTNEAGQPES